MMDLFWKEKDHFCFQLKKFFFFFFNIHEFFHLNSPESLHTVDTKGQTSFPFLAHSSEKNKSRIQKSHF